jgi:hypothetical protein
METSRYASRLAPESRVLPSGRPLQGTNPNQASPYLETAVASWFEMPGEPDDARLTGGTRSLSRRLLALNIPRIPADAMSLSASCAKSAGGSVRSRAKSRKPLLTKSSLVSQDA